MCVRTANRYSGWQVIGGRLSITTERIVFTPNVVEYQAGRTGWECDLAAVRGVAAGRRAAPGWGALARARRRLFVGTDNREATFSMRQADEVVEAIERARRSCSVPRPKLIPADRP